MNHTELTINTYDKSAKQLAEYFRGIGPRVEDIKLGLSLSQGESLQERVVEIGCGDGRDATEIIGHVGWYQGFDPSEGLLDLARQNAPKGNFVRADALSYQYPQNLDIVFAFASLLHVNRQDFAVVSRMVSSALREGGIFFISLKERDQYTEEMKTDDYGKRMFYYYNVGLVKELVGDKFEVVNEDHQKIGSTKWFTLALRRK